MPLYDYQCKSCLHVFEAFNTVEDRKLTKCPMCGQDADYRIAAPRLKLPFNDPAFSTSWDAWERKRKQKMAQEAKQGA